MGNHKLYNDNAFPTETTFLNVMDTIEEHMINYIENYNGYMGMIVEAIEEGKPIPTTSDHQRYIISLLYEFYSKSYPKEIELFNGTLVQSNSRETLPDFNDKITMSFSIAADSIRYNMNRFYPGMPSAAWARRNRDPDIPGEEIFIRFGFLPIKYTMLIPNLTISGKSHYFLQRFHNHYIHRCLTLQYENSYSNLVRHTQPTQPVSKRHNADRNYIVDNVFLLPITEVATFKSRMEITDITISGTHSILNSNAGTIPSLKIIKKDDE